MRFLMQTCPPREAVFMATLASAPASTEVVTDTGGGNLQTFLRVLELAGADPFVFLEDDLIFTTGFESKITALLEKHPFMVASFFSFRSDMQQDQAGMTSHPGAKFWSNLCVYYPPGFAKAVLSFYRKDRAAHDAEPHGDLLVRRFLETNRMSFLHYVPNLVQHKDGPSVSMKGNRRRVSGTFAP